PDVFLLRAMAVSNTAFVAKLYPSGSSAQHVERTNYRGVESLTLNTLGGDDSVTSDDTLAVTTINGGIGNDTFQVGQVFKSQRGSTELGIDDILDKDVPTLIAKLSSGSDALSSYVWNQFSFATKQLLQDPSLSVVQTKPVLIDALNNVILGAALNPNLVSNKSQATIALINSNPVGGDLWRLNRLLLDDAYAPLLAQPYSTDSLALSSNIGRDDVFGTIEVTRGWLSNGNSAPMIINGGDGNDSFTVFQNKKSLAL